MLGDRVTRPIYETEDNTRAEREIATIFADAMGFDVVRPTRKLSDEQVKAMREQLDGGTPARLVAELFGVTPSTARAIRDRHLRKEASNGARSGGL